MSGSVSDYIARLEQQLRQRGIVDPRILAESREHLIDAIEEGRGRGLPAADAEHEAFERFGSPEIVAAHILKERDLEKTGLAGAFAAIWRCKWWILGPTMIAAVIAVVASNFQPIRYRAEATILVVPPHVPENYDRSILTMRIEERVRLIEHRVRSGASLERIIEDLNLYPERRKKDGLQDIIEDMNRAIDVEIVTNDLFRVAFTSDSPRTAMQVTEQLAAFFIGKNLDGRATLADDTSEFLETQVAEVGNKLREIEEKMVDYKRLHRRQVPVNDMELVVLTRDYTTLRSQFDSLSAKRLEAQVAANLERRQISEQFRILDSARLPEHPVGPNRFRAALTGALVGLAVGLALVAFRRSSNPRPPTLAEA